MQIILRAVADGMVRKAAKTTGSYFESHHIIPKSLGGSNDIKNRVLLTAKEHYVCHHLLVYMYPQNSIECKKMICAWWAMVQGRHHDRRPLSASEYAKVRLKFATAIGSLTTISQAGARNSRYGAHWYTNIDTGISMSFMSPPGSRWVRGRDLFKSTTSRAPLWSIFTKRPVTVKNGKILGSVHEFKARASNKGQMAARAIWDKYHSGKWESLHKFCLESGIGISIVALTRRFKQYIPIYSRVCNNSKKFQPDVSMIHVYE